MINEKLVQQVREGKASIDIRIKNARTVNQYAEVVELAGYKTTYPWDRYFWIANGGLHHSNTPPTGLTPIPLDNFFKGEEESNGKWDKETQSATYAHPPRSGEMTPPPQSSLPSGVQTTTVKFGDYINVPQKRYGVNDEIYLHKVIGVLQSNLWMDVPAIQHKGMVVHDTVEEVVSCIVCGVGEDRVIRYRLKDCTLATPSLPPSEEKGVEAFKVVSDRINWFSNHHHKFEANELHEALNTIMRLVPPENFNLKTINNGK